MLGRHRSSWELPPTPQYDNPNVVGDSLASSSDPLAVYGEDENKERGNWSGKLDFLLSCLGYAVGLGNVWRFPYICGRNGGGAFFIPYIIMLAFVGMPIFFLELSLGQFKSEGPITLWSVSPLFSGIGYGMVVVSFIVGIYYNLIISWTLYYLFASFQSVLPWSYCDNEWNTQNCFDLTAQRSCNASQGVLFRKVCYNASTAHRLKITHELAASEPRASPSEEYFDFRVMKIDPENPGLTGMHGLDWEMVLCLLLAWILVCACLCRGIKSSGKVVYFTATFPYLVLVILLIRGATLEGAIDGIKFYLIPKFSKLRNPQVWTDAAGQIFFSLSCGGGGLATLASYNRFKNNCYRDTLIVTIGNCLTSIFAGFVIFSIVGFMAHDRGVSVESIAKGGTGLAFSAYPEAVTKMPVPQLWAIIFFVMLLTLGLDSQFVMVEVVNTALLDKFHFLRPRKTLTMIGISVVMFMLGLPMCAKGGIYLHQLVDTMASGWSVIFIGIFELIAISWLYDFRPLVVRAFRRPFYWRNMRHLFETSNFGEDISMMVGYPPNIYWRVCWRFISPILIIAILIYSWVDYSPIMYGSTYTYAPWAQAMGWFVALASTFMIPLVGIVILCTLNRPDLSVWQKICFLCQPTEEWGPALDQHRTGMYKPRRQREPVVEKHKPIYTMDTEGVDAQAYVNPAYNNSLETNI